MSMENTETKKAPKKKGGMKWIVPAITAVIIAAAVVIAVPLPTQESEEERTSVITVSTLEKIINTSELSTFTAIYNGIAEVMSTESPEEIDYYVSYEALNCNIK